MADNHGNQQSFERFLEVGRRRAWLGLSVFLLGAALTLAFTWSLPPLYQASVTLDIAGTGAHSDSSVINPPPLGAVTQQVMSRDNLEAIIKNYNLFPDASKNASTKNLVARLQKGITIKKTQENIEGTYRKQTIGFTLSYMYWDPETAANVTNALARSYQDTAREIRVDQAKQRSAALSSSMALVREKLASQRKAVLDFNKKHLGALPQDKDLSIAHLNRLYGKLRADQQGELNAINRRASLLDRMNSSGDSTLPQLKQKLHELKLQYTDQYPEVIQLKRKIAALENQSQSGQSAQSASPMQEQLNDVNMELQQFRASEAKTRAEISSAQSQLSNLPITGQKLQALTQGNEQTAKVYSTLLSQYEQARVVAATAGKGSSFYTVIDPALTTSSPLGPKRLRFGVMFIILCAVIALAAIMISEKLDTTFHTLDELRDFTSVPILATVPVIKRRRDKVGRFMRACTMVMALALGIVVLGGVGYATGHGNQAISQMFTSQGS